MQTQKIIHHRKRATEREKKKKSWKIQTLKYRISTEAHQHLGSVVGSKQFCENYTSSLITQSCEEITELQNYL